MSQRRRRTCIAGMAILAAALSSTHTTGLACGFHDDVTLARGIMNWVYPDALHVIGALEPIREEVESLESVVIP